MQNVLILPTALNKKKTFVKRVKEWINNYQEKKKKEYNKKRQFLKDECYKVFLPKVLEKRNSKEIDFPNFVYEKRLAICSEALDLAEKAVFMTERIYGRKHIEKCYSIKIKQNLRNKKN